MFGDTAKEKVMGITLEAIFNAVYRACKDPTLTLQERMDNLAWVQKKIPEIRRLAIVVQTEKINK